MKIVCVMLLAVALCACSKQEAAPEPATSAPPAKVVATPVKVVATNPPAQKEPSTLETAVDGFTGQTAVRNGRKAQDRIRGVVRDRNADLKDVDSFGR